MEDCTLFPSFPKGVWCRGKKTAFGLIVAAAPPPPPPPPTPLPQTRDPYHRNDGGGSLSRNLYTRVVIIGQRSFCPSAVYVLRVRPLVHVRCFPSRLLLLRLFLAGSEMCLLFRRFSLCLRSVFFASINVSL